MLLPEQALGLFTRTEIFTLIKTLRFSRHLHYSVIFSFGYYLGLQKLFLSFNIFYFLTGLFWINILFFMAMILNNIYDRKIDELNNKQNPLNLGLKEKDYFNFYLILLSFSLILSGFLGWKILILTIFINLLGYFYSVSPLRFKKIFPVNTMVISFCTVITIFSGFLFSTQGKSFDKFPFDFALALFFVLSLAFNVKDINDYKGDKKYKIMTLMTIFGEKKGKLIINFLMLFAYLIFPFLIGLKVLILPAILSGALTFLIIHKSRKLNEIPVFFIFFLFIFLYILIQKT